MSVKIVFGLGNPGKEYEGTRHNVGFEILDNFAKKHNLAFTEGNGDYYEAGGKNLFASSFFLVKPVTFVNASGIAAMQVIDRYDVEIRDFLVVVDDINLQPGQIRIREKGGDGGHNGLHSIIYSLESDSFPRLRFGIGAEFKRGEMANYVLSKFDPDTRKIIDLKINNAIEYIEAFLKGGYSEMVKYLSIKNRKLQQEE